MDAITQMKQGFNTKKPFEQRRDSTTQKKLNNATKSKQNLIKINKNSSKEFNNTK